MRPNPMHECRGAAASLFRLRSLSSDSEATTRRKCDADGAAIGQDDVGNNYESNLSPRLHSLKSPVDIVSNGSGIDGTSTGQGSHCTPATSPAASKSRSVRGLTPKKRSSDTTQYSVDSGMRSPKFPAEYATGYAAASNRLPFRSSRCLGREVDYNDMEKQQPLLSQRNRIMPKAVCGDAVDYLSPTTGTHKRRSPRGVGGPAIVHVGGADEDALSMPVLKNGKSSLQKRRPRPSSKQDKWFRRKWWVILIVSISSMSLHAYLLLIELMKSTSDGVDGNPNFPNESRESNLGRKPTAIIPSATGDVPRVAQSNEIGYTYTDPETGSVRMGFTVLPPPSTANITAEGGNVLGVSRTGTNHRTVFYATPLMEPFVVPSWRLMQRTMARKQQNLTVLDPMFRVTPGEEAVEQDHPRVPYFQGTCEPMVEWQMASLPNCNSLHEIDLVWSSGMSRIEPSTRSKIGRASEVFNGKDFKTLGYLEDRLQLLGMGWFRQAWRLDAGTTGDVAVMKTLRLERDFYDEFYDLHRRDAMAMERLTFSPYVMNIYGYCGQSALNELADFGEGGFANLEKFARQLRDKNTDGAAKLKLQMATMVSIGVAHLHEIDYAHNATMVHYDINPRNIAVVQKGRPKINDFNVAEFLRWNPENGAPCGFSGRFKEPWWRAPEEMIMKPQSPNDPEPPMLTEKVDIYALGNVLFDLLTGHSPRGKMKKERMDAVREVVARGEPPTLSDFYVKSDNPAIVAIREAMKKCFRVNPKDRPSARDIAIELRLALKSLPEGFGKKKEKK